LTFLRSKETEIHFGAVKNASLTPSGSTPNIVDTFFHVTMVYKTKRPVQCGILITSKSSYSWQGIE